MSDIPLPFDRADFGVFDHDADIGIVGRGATVEAAFAGGAQRTYLWLIADGLSGRVLGVHLPGTDAPEFAQSLAMARTSGASKHDFNPTLAVHPTAAGEFVLMREPVRRTRGGVT